jgi:hypothetical protein
VRPDGMDDRVQCGRKGERSSVRPVGGCHARPR